MFKIRDKMSGYTIDIEKTRLHKALIRLRDRFFEHIEKVASGESEKFVINKKIAEELMAEFNNVDTEVFTQNAILGSMIVTIKSVNDKIVEYGLDQVEDHIFEEQKKVWNEIIEKLKTLDNIKAKKD